MELTQLLRGVELFHGLADEDLDQIAAIFEEVRYHSGELIAKQSSPGDTLFLVAEGFVEVTIEEGDSQTPQVLVNLGQGQIFGEMALVDQGPRSANVRAISEPTVVQAVHREAFESLCREYTHIGYTVMRNIAADLSFKLRQRHLAG